MDHLNNSPMTLFVLPCPGFVIELAPVECLKFYFEKVLTLMVFYLVTISLILGKNLRHLNYPLDVADTSANIYSHSVVLDVIFVAGLI